jgi:hypothetical protein
MSVTTSSWVGPKQKSRWWRSSMRSSSRPYFAQRPDSCHSSAGWIAGIDSSTAPAASISRRTMASSFLTLRQPIGR